VGSRHAGIKDFARDLHPALPGWMIWLRSGDVRRRATAQRWLGVESITRQGRGIGWTPDLTGAA